MGKSGRWLGPIAALALASACALTDVKPATKPASTTANANLFALPKVDTSSVGEAQTAIDEFRDLNSSSNFTMPIGNNFTMPIGNNFTMPIGNNLIGNTGAGLIGNTGAGLIGNTGAGYRIATTVANQMFFGFAPIPAGADFVSTGGSPLSLPKKGEAARTGSVMHADGSIDAAVSLDWWDDDKNANAEGYADKITYKKLRVAVGGKDQNLSGDYTLKLSGPNTAGNFSVPDSDKNNLGGILLLGQNANPQATLRRREEMNLKLGANPVVSLTVDQKSFEKFIISLPKPGKKEGDPVSVNIPNAVDVAGSLSSPQGNAGLGISLGATADFTNKAFSLVGWLKPCKTGGACTASTAASKTGSPGEVREEFTLDVASAQSKLKFSRLGEGARYGWEATMYFDYAALLLNGVGGTSALTGELWLIDSTGTKIAGGKMADIAFENGNPVFKYLDGRREIWKL